MSVVNFKTAVKIWCWMMIIHVRCHKGPFWCRCQNVTPAVKFWRRRCSHPVIYDWIFNRTTEYHCHALKTVCIGETRIFLVTFWLTGDVWQHLEEARKSIFVQSSAIAGENLFQSQWMTKLKVIFTEKCWSLKKCCENCAAGGRFLQRSCEQKYMIKILTKLSKAWLIGNEWRLGGDHP